MNDYIYSKDGHKRYKAVCRQCGADRGYQAPSKLDRVCLKCYRKKLEDRFVEPTKEYSFINYGDTVVKHDRVRYRASCPQCGKDRGYKRPNKFNQVCMDCQHTRHSKIMMGHPSPRKMRSEEHKKIHSAVSSRLGHCLRKRGSRKKVSIRESLPYTVLDLMQHLEKRFYHNPVTNEMMNWGNYGQYGWHIDHIMPDSRFSYKTEEDLDFKKCWALDNLQPMWWFENIRKSNKIL